MICSAARISSVATAIRRSRGRSGVGHQLVVLDQVDRGVGELAHDRPELLLRQPHVRFDDRADHDACDVADQASCSWDTEGRARVRGDELRRQLQVQHPAGEQLLQLEQVPRDRRLQGRQVGTDVLHRPLDHHARPRGPSPAGSATAVTGYGGPGAARPRSGRRAVRATPPTHRAPTRKSRWTARRP